MTLAKITEEQATAMEQVIINGDLGTLTPSQRLNYYRQVCHSLGLNPYTKPFAYIRLNNRLTLYALRDCADQLRAIHKLSVSIVSRETVNDVYVVTARATTPDGRNDESIGAVAIKGLTGESLANALMKTETKAKRRVTLSIAGLGWLDETEAATIPDSQIIEVNTETGEITRPALTPPAQTPPAASPPQQRQPAQNGQAAKPGARGVGPERAALFAALKAAREAAGWSQPNFLAHVQNNYGVQTVNELTDEQVATATAYLLAEASETPPAESPTLPGVSVAAQD